MARALVLAVFVFVFVVPQSVHAQSVGTLHIKIVLADADQRPTPVSRHQLLISDNPSTDAPRLVTTGLDGTAEVKLRPGNYTVESDHAVAFHGKSYEWTERVDIVAGRDVTLELTAANADVGTAAPETTGGDASKNNDPSFLLPEWQDSVVAIWTPTARASAFLVDEKGLIATNQRVVGTATSVEVQLAPAVKVRANVLAADAGHDAAVLWVDSAAVARMKPVPLKCDTAETLQVAEGQPIFTIGSPFRQDQKELATGKARTVSPNGFETDFRLAAGSLGGPVFSADGAAVGLTSPIEEENGHRRGDLRTVRTADVCATLPSAEAKMTDANRPVGAHLPIEPTTPFPLDELRSAAERRGGSLNPYQVSSAGFDVAFITPVMVYGVQLQAERANRRASGGGSGQSRTVSEPPLVRPLMNFFNWSSYVDDFPPVLLVRITPRMTENFWTTVARGAAQTQGMAIPAIKRVKSGFARMRAYCGDAEVIPIHPFTLEHQLADNNAVDEGLYVFDPGAFGPQCASVRLVLYSVKEPDKEDARVVESRVIDQIWQDFAPFRAATH